LGAIEMNKKLFLILSSFLLVIINSVDSLNQNTFCYIDESPYVKEYTHCDDNKGNNLFYYFDEQSKYQWIGWLYDCKSNENFVLLKSKNGEFIEIDRTNTLIGAKVNFKLIKNKGLEYIIIILGFEPNQINDSFLIEVYDLIKNEKIASCWSSEEPYLSDINDDGDIEMVIYKNIFSLDIAGLPNWPIILHFNKALIIEDLHDYQKFVRYHLSLMKDSIKDLQLQCNEFNDECPFIDRMDKLIMQEKLLSNYL
jgi:hypothetical protein